MREAFMAVALVTGTSTGIGQATALHLARQGLDVHAGLRTVESGADLLNSASIESLRVTPVILDVNDDESVRPGHAPGAGRGRSRRRPRQQRRDRRRRRD